MSATSPTLGPNPPRPTLAVPPRPARPLSTLSLLRTAATDTLGICDEEVFNELIVVRRHGPVTLAFVSDPAGVRQVLIEQADDYPRLPTIRRLYASEIGTGTLATDGDLWRRHRRVAVPALDRRAIAPDLPTLAAMAEDASAALGAGAGAGPMNIEACMAAIWVSLLNQVSTGGDPRGPAILHWLGKVPRKPRALDLLPLPAWLSDRISPAKQSPERAALRQELLGMVASRRDASYAGPKDMLWRIAHGKDPDGSTLPLHEARDEASSLIGAGDASIRALTWIWYLLALHPDAEARMHAELDAVLGDGPIQPDHLPMLTYTRRVMDEAMRLYPPIPIIVRQARRGGTICGRRIPRGSIVLVMPWVVHRHHRLWTDPGVFDPERFTEQASRDRPRLAYIPFSAGPRVCSGAHLAIKQMTVIVAALARRYRFRLAPDRPVVPFGGISLHPRNGLWVTLERR